MSSGPGQPAPLGLRTVLSIPGFRRLWISQLVSIFGDFLALYAGWQWCRSNCTARRAR